MPAPILLLAGPFSLALLLFLIRRWPKPAALTGAAGLLLLRWLLTGISLDAGSESAGLFQGSEWLVLGRSLSLTQPVQDLFAFIYLALALLFLVTIVVPQGRLFYTVAVALFAPLAAALLIQPLVFGVVGLLIVAAGVAVLIQDGQAGSTLASFRYLKMTALAVPLLLLSAWLGETDLATHFSTIWRLFLFGSLIMLAGFPFHIWVIPIWHEARPLVSVVVFGLVQLALVSFIGQFLAEFPIVQRNAQFLQLLQISGALTALAAGFLALTAQSAERLVGHLLLVDMGVVAMSLGLISQSDLAATQSLVILRLAGLVLVSVGLALLRGRLPADGDGRITYALTRGWGWRVPSAVVLVAYGGLSLLGLPLTPGFAGRWLVLELTGGQNPLLLFLIVLGMAAATIGVLRYLAVLLGPAGRADDPLILPAPIAPRWQQAAIWFLILLGALLAIFPQWLMEQAQRIAAGS